jgi:DNA-binding winged helix-turn-helix (wHTH) protein
LADDCRKQPGEAVNRRQIAYAKAMTTAGQIDLATALPFRIGPLTVIPALRQVTAATSETLEPRVMQVLVQLAMANGAIVSRAELVRQCWEGRIVGDDAVNRVIVRLRHLLDEHGDATARIETITKVGYRLVGPVVLTAPAARPPLPSEAPLATVAAGSALVDTQYRQPATPVTARTVPPTSSVLPLAKRYTPWLVSALLLIAALGAGWRLIGPGAAPAAKPIIAVLPFTDMSEANGKAYFC